MMETCILRKVAYRLPKKNQIRWAFVLAQQEGLTLLFVPRPDEKRSHALVVAVEDIKSQVFEAANGASQFPLEHGDMAAVGMRLHALAENLSDDEFRRMFKPDDWWNE
jgi:hypothetical protein